MSSFAAQNVSEPSESWLAKGVSINHFTPNEDHPLPLTDGAEIPRCRVDLRRVAFGSVWFGVFDPYCFPLELESARMTLHKEV